MIPLYDNVATRTKPYVTIATIVSCFIVFLWQTAHTPQIQQQIVFSFGFIPGTLFGSHELVPALKVLPSAMTIFTSMFLHGSLWHLIGNMLYLWIFGNNVEDAMGSVRFVVFYLLCGFVAAMAQALPEPDSVIPMIGASGAVSGVLGAYLLLHPFARVLVVIPIGFYPYTTYLPAAVVLGIWFLLQLLSSLVAEPGQGGVAWFAHVGGFVAGMLFIVFFRRRGTPLWHPGVR